MFWVKNFIGVENIVNDTHFEDQLCETYQYREFLSNETKTFLRQINVAFLLLLIPPIIVGNVLLVASVCVFPRLRDVSHVMLASLAGSDLFVGFVAIPLYVAQTLAHDYFESGHYRCLALLAVARWFTCW